MNYLTDDERQLLLKLIDTRLPTLSGRLGGEEYKSLIALRRKIEGVDKRIKVES
jgi:hypothetical protein